MCKMQFTLHERNILLRCMNLHHVKHSQGTIPSKKKKFCTNWKYNFLLLNIFAWKKKKTDFFQIRYTISPYSYLLGIRCEIWSYFIYGSDIRPSNNMSVNEIIWNFNAFTPVPFGKLSHNFFQIWYTPGISHDQKMQIFSLGMFQNASICGDKLIF